MRLKALAVALVAALGLAACGSSKKSSSASTSTPAASSTTGGTATPAKSGPGVGKPAVTIGDKNFTEEYILGALYQQALAAKGYKVTLKGNIGTSEITYKALTSGQIQMYPEYTGTMLTAIANITAPPKSAQQAYTEAQAFAQKHGFVLLNPTPFYDTDALGALTSYAQKNHLKAIADLKKLGSAVKLGGPPEFQTRAQGLVGLKKTYGINPTFVPLTIGLIYKSLDSGAVSVSDVFSTDPQLLSGKYVLLADPKHVFGFQNVAPIVKKSVLKAEGPAFQQTINKVSALLTVPAIQKMNEAVSVSQQSPASVAHAFLAANGLG